MFAECTNNDNTWRNVLTIEKSYEVVRKFDSEYSGEIMVDIICDDGELRTYRGERFKLS